MPDTPHEHHIDADTQLDSLALARALIRQDAEALNTVLAHAECGQCLAVSAMQWGFSLAAWAGGDTAATEGRPVGTPEFRARIEEVIDSAQRQLREGMTAL